MRRAAISRALKRAWLCLSVAVFVGVAPAAAGAYSCTLSPNRDSVIVKTDNRDSGWKVCTVACTFAAPEGYVTFTCWQSIPGGARGWEVCVRPTNGKALGALENGSEHCVARPPGAGN